MKTTTVVRVLAALGLVAAAALTQQYPLKQDTEKLTRGAVRIDKVKEGLYVIRGPFVPWSNLTFLSAIRSRATPLWEAKLASGLKTTV